MQRLRFEAADENDTDRLGVALANLLPETIAIALEGTLGAGKTRLAQAIATGCGVAEGVVTSPTFVLCQPYHARRSIYHLDAYRVRDLDEFLELGVEEYFAGPGLTLIEWADRVAACLPDELLTIRIEIAGESARQFELIARGLEIEKALERIAEQLCDASSR